MPWITNVALYKILNGDHPHDDNTILIRILNDTSPPPEPKYQFKDVHCFSFLDIDIEEHPSAITEEQAQQIAALLVEAKRNGTNVLVHCTMGMCRSGAVVDAALPLGFEEIPNVFRSPNVLVRSRILKALDLFQDYS